MFALVLFTTLWISTFWTAGLLRYDFILAICVLFQGLTVILKLESWREIFAIAIFHAVGIGLETYKVAHGSWVYPDQGSLWVGQVPLFSGFMYASVASYKLRAWSVFNLKFEKMPSWIWATIACALIYGNFFANRLIGDHRWLISALVCFIFGRTWVLFNWGDSRAKMPLVVAFVLIGFFVWVAENICSALGAWQYPYQRDAWQFVDVGKLSSWSLMTIVSFCIIAWIQGEFNPGGSRQPELDEKNPLIKDQGIKVRADY